MFLSNINIMDGIIHSISIVGVFIQQPILLALTIVSVLFTALASRYTTHQKAERLQRQQTLQKKNSAELGHQNDLMKQMIQNQKR